MVVVFYYWLVSFLLLDIIVITRWSLTLSSSDDKLRQQMKKEDEVLFIPSANVFHQYQYYHYNLSLFTQLNLIPNISLEHTINEVNCIFNKKQAKNSVNCVNHQDRMHSFIATAKQELARSIVKSVNEKENIKKSDDETLLRYLQLVSLFQIYESALYNHEAPYCEYEWIMVDDSSSSHNAQDQVKTKKKKNSAALHFQIQQNNCKLINTFASFLQDQQSNSVKQFIDDKGINSVSKLFPPHLQEGNGGSSFDIYLKSPYTLRKCIVDDNFNNVYDVYCNLELDFLHRHLSTTKMAVDYEGQYVNREQLLKRQPSLCVNITVILDHEFYHAFQEFGAYFAKNNFFTERYFNHPLRYALFNNKEFCLNFDEEHYFKQFHKVNYNDNHIDGKVGSLEENNAFLQHYLSTHATLYDYSNFNTIEPSSDNSSKQLEKQSERENLFHCLFKYSSGYWRKQKPDEDGDDLFKSIYPSMQLFSQQYQYYSPFLVKERQLQRTRADSSWSKYVDSGSIIISSPTSNTISFQSRHRSSDAAEQQQQKPSEQRAEVHLVGASHTRYNYDFILYQNLLWNYTHHSSSSNTTLKSVEQEEYKKLFQRYNSMMSNYAEHHGDSNHNWLYYKQEFWIQDLTRLLNTYCDGIVQAMESSPSSSSNSGNNHQITKRFIIFQFGTWDTTYYPIQDLFAKTKQWLIPCLQSLIEKKCHHYLTLTYLTPPPVADLCHDDADNHLLSTSTCRKTFGLYRNRYSLQAYVHYFIKELMSLNYGEEHLKIVDIFNMILPRFYYGESVGTSHMLFREENSYLATPAGWMTLELLELLMDELNRSINK